MQMLFAGVDSGGTSTRVALASADGSVAAWGRSSGANPFHVGWKGAEEAVAAALDAALGGAPRSAVSGIFLGMAGVVSAQDRQDAVALLRNLGLAPECEIDADHDIRIALEGGRDGRPGIALIAGTGSSCYGRNAAGETWQGGGWDVVMDDLGSGFDLVRRGMAAAVQSADGRLSPSALEPMLFDALQARDVGDFCVKVHRPAMARHEIAALAPIVLAAAEQGDDAARRILETAADELARMVLCTAKRLFAAEPAEVVLLGGLLDHPSPYRTLVEASIRRDVPRAAIHAAQHIPATGALSLAAKACCQTLPESLLLHMDHFASLPA